MSVEREVSRGRSSSPLANEGPNVRKDESFVRLDIAMVQKSLQLELPLDDRGEAPTVRRSGQALSAFCESDRPGTDTLMEQVLDRLNLKRALKRVQRNQGVVVLTG